MTRTSLFSCLVVLLALLWSGLAVPWSPPTTLAAPTPSSAGIKEVRVPHFVESDPAHGGLYALSRKEVVIRFNARIIAGSGVVVERGEIAFTAGPAIIERKALVLRRALRNLEPGTYQVRYTACWLDRTCHEGRFGFAVQPRT